jgi:hypothetical protein
MLIFLLTFVFLVWIVDATGVQGFTHQGKTLATTINSLVGAADVAVSAHGFVYVADYRG